MSSGYENNYPTSGFGSASQLREEFDKLKTALDDTVSRTNAGVGANSMASDMDMDNNDILNVKDIVATKVYVGGRDLSELSDVIDTAEEFNDKWLGALAAEPTTNNDGGPLSVGATYFNLTSGIFYVYTGASWVTTIAPPQTFSESITLSSGQVVAVFVSDTTYGSFYISGDGVGNSRLVVGVDYSVDHPSKTVTLTDSYPAGTTLFMEYSA